MPKQGWMGWKEGETPQRRPLLRRGGRYAVPEPGYWLGLAALTGAYVASAKFGINLSVAHGVITPVWAPSGISLAALLLFGPRLWPAVALGAFIANATSGAEPVVSAGIAVGNTLAAVAGAYLLRRVGFRLGLERVRDVLALVVLGAGVSTLISATNGVTVLFLAEAAHGSYGSEWLLWWFGDAVGNLLVAPLLLVAFSSAKTWPTKARLLEALLVVASLAALSAVVFLAGAWRYPYVIFPLLLWAALRFRQLGAATSAFVVGAIATWGTVAGTLPIGASSPTERVQIVQALVGILAISLLVVGATLAERETVNAELKRTAARLSEAQALTHIGSWEWEIGPNTVTWSEEVYRIWGLDPDRFGGSYEAYLETVHPDERDSVDASVREAFETGGFDYECRIVRPDGAERVIHARGKVVADESGTPLKMIGTGQDITERRHLEEQLRQSQKLEAVGRLAGGVAHDFNNILMAISGYSERALGQLDEGGRVPRRGIEEIRKAADRATALTRQLLAFSRQQVLQPTVLDLNAVVGDMETMLRRLIGEDIDLVTDLDEELGPVTADVGQLEQVIVNLAVNARDAMPRGGRLMIETANAELDDAYLSEHFTVSPGRYAMLAVTDTGSGMDAKTQTRVFEPFFTTKEQGKGTGLGLATVYGIVKQSGGYIWVYSEPGRGTTFKIYLPRADEALEPRVASATRETPLHGSETILVVEDEDVVRALIREMLEQNGYTVLAARDAQAAVQTCTEYGDLIHLLVTDVVMPEVSGPELVDRLALLRPNMGVVYTSGYTDDAIVRHGVVEPAVIFLQKPFTHDALARKVREALDLAEAAGRGPAAISAGDGRQRLDAGSPAR